MTGIGTTIDTAWPSDVGAGHLPQEYLQSVVHRSTSYTYRMPFKIGVCAADGDETALRDYSRLGEEIGLAFQIIDDQLNVDPRGEVWGKATGEDITAGKVTLQVLLTAELASTPDWEHLTEILRSGTTDQTQLREAVSIMRRCGALTESRRIADQHLDTCQDIIRGMTFLQGDTAPVLESLVDYLGRRDR